MFTNNLNLNNVHLLSQLNRKRKAPESTAESTECVSEKEQNTSSFIKSDEDIFNHYLHLLRLDPSVSPSTAANKLKIAKNVLVAWCDLRKDEVDAAKKYKQENSFARYIFRNYEKEKQFQSYLRLLENNPELQFSEAAEILSSTGLNISETTLRIWARKRTFEIEIIKAKIKNKITIKLNNIQQQHLEQYKALLKRNPNISKTRAAIELGISKWNITNLHVLAENEIEQARSEGLQFNPDAFPDSTKEELFQSYLANLRINPAVPSLQDSANKMGISLTTLREWRIKRQIEVTTAEQIGKQYQSLIGVTPNNNTSTNENYQPNTIYQEDLLGVSPFYNAASDHGNPGIESSTLMSENAAFHEELSVSSFYTAATDHGNTGIESSALMSENAAFHDELSVSSFYTDTSDYGNTGIESSALMSENAAFHDEFNVNIDNFDLSVSFNTENIVQALRSPNSSEFNSNTNLNAAVDPTINAQDQSDHAIILDSFLDGEDIQPLSPQTLMNLSSVMDSFENELTNDFSNFKKY